VLIEVKGRIHSGLDGVIDEEAGSTVDVLEIAALELPPSDLSVEEDVPEEAEVDLVLAPSVEAMYPDGFATRLAPEGAAKAGLEDEFRPLFFGGVATVVAKLFTQVSPDFALFGQKDYQQLRVVTQMAKDLDLQVKVIGIPTVREPDGLALSSRNVYLSAAERAVAPMLHRVLKGCATRIRSGEKVDRVLNVGRIEIDLAGFALDYLEARHALTLTPITSPKDGPIRLLVAARLGKTRLIDNVGV
jgi:pantoate--beta-alanine ligase